MPFRNVFTDDEAFRAWKRGVDDFISQAGAGHLHRGKVSFDRTTQQGLARKFVDLRAATPGNVYNDLFSFSAVSGGEGGQVEFGGHLELENPRIEFLPPGDYAVIFGGQLWAGEGSE